MISIENPKIFAGCVAGALVTIDNNASLNTIEKFRAVNAVAKAASRIDTDGAFMDYDGDVDRLVIWSQGSNNVYEMSPGQNCGCPAHLNGVICWHKAAKRLIELYISAAFLAAKSFDSTQMPYLKSATRPVEICGGVRI
jgi:hypothetical protein